MFTFTYNIYVVLAMAGTTQKSCVAVFPLWSLKKNFCFCFLRGRGRQSNVNQQKHTKNSKFEFDKKSH